MDNGVDLVVPGGEGAAPGRGGGSTWPGGSNGVDAGGPLCRQLPNALAQYGDGCHSPMIIPIYCAQQNAYRTFRISFALW